MVFRSLILTKGKQRDSALTSCPCPQVLKTLGSPDLARSIISPHLCRDTVDFLLGHLTPKETSIFELLGDGWTKPR